MSRSPWSRRNWRSSSPASRGAPPRISGRNHGTRADGGRRAGGVAVGHHHAEWAQAVERLHEGVLADGVVDDRDALPLGDLLDARRHLVAAGDQHVLAAVLAGKIRLGVAADYTDDL